MQEAIQEHLRTFGGVLLLVLLDRASAGLLRILGIPFSSFVFSMVLVYVFLTMGRRRHHGTTQRVVDWFSPSCAFLGRWMPLFFLPPLVLVVTQRAPTPTDLVLLIAIGLGGFLASFWLGGSLAQMLSRREPLEQTTQKRTDRFKWPRRVVLGGFSVLVLSGAATVSFGTLARVHFGVALSIVAYVGADLLRETLKRWRLNPLSAISHPVLVGAALVALCWQKMGLPWHHYLQPLSEGPSPGGILAFFLQPAVVALGFALDAARHSLKEKAWPLFSCAALSAAFSLFFTAILATALGLSRPYSLAVVSRSVTTPVALSMAERLGADEGLTAMIVVLTGVLGALFALPLGRRLRFDSPFVLGVATGASSHGIGTAELAREHGPAAAFSGITFSLTAVFSAAYLSHPWVRDALLQLL